MRTKKLKSSSTQNRHALTLAHSILNLVENLWKRLVSNIIHSTVNRPHFSSIVLVWLHKNGAYLGPPCGHVPVSRQYTGTFQSCRCPHKHPKAKHPSCTGSEPHVLGAATAWKFNSLCKRIQLQAEDFGSNNSIAILFATKFGKESTNIRQQKRLVTLNFPAAKLIQLRERNQ